MELMWGVVIVVVMVSITNLVLVFMQKRQICKSNASLGEAMQKEKADILQQVEDSYSKLRQQMFVHEAKLLNEHGLWCLEHDGEKKIFTPGILQKVISGNEESIFKHTDNSIICSVAQDGQIKSEIVFTKGGTPISGTVFDNGKIVKSFKYDELGQVVENSEEK